MTPEIEKIYEKICQIAYGIVPADFRQLWVRSEIFDGVSTTGLYYQAGSGEHHFVAEGLYELDDALNELHETIASAGEQAFSSATVRMNSEGKFSFDFGYDDVSDLEKQFEREDAWIAVYLGSDVKINYET